MKVEPQKEHAWLTRLVGEWTYEGECAMGPDQAKAKFNGTDRVRSVGGLWVICEGEGEMPEGGVAKTVMTLGYDPQRQRFVGTFIGSMMTYLWQYEGGLDPAERVLTLDAEGPSMSGEGIAKYQDVMEIRSDDHRVFSSRMLGEDGTWHPFMESHYRRVK